MWQRFTERARRVVFFAQEEAARLGENYVGTEHLLLGLIRESDSVSARVLDLLKIPLGRLRADIERQVTRGHGNLGQDMQLTPRAKRVIDLAYEEARELNNNYIGTEHLLLGLIREGDGLAARVLVNLGASAVLTRQVVQELQVEESESAIRDKLGLSRPAPPPARAAIYHYEVSRLEGAGVHHLTRKALQALMLAGRGPEGASMTRLLAALLRVGDCSARRILTRLEVDVEALRAELPDEGVDGDDESPPPVDPRLAEALDRAFEEARWVGSMALGTDHLLLALARAPASPAGAALIRDGRTLETLREQALAVHQGEPTPADDVAGQPEVSEEWCVQRTKRLLERAREQAAMRNTEEAIEPDHLLLALLSETDSVANRALERLAVPLEWLRWRLESQAGSGEGTVDRQLPLSPASRTVIRAAWDLAQNSGRSGLTPEDVLLAYLQCGRGAGVSFLVEEGVTSDRLQEAMSAVDDEPA